MKKIYKIFGILFVAIVLGFAIYAVVPNLTTKEIVQEEPQTEIVFGASNPFAMDNVQSQVTSAKKFTTKRGGFNTLCKRYQLPNDINQWYGTAFNDYETKGQIKEFVLFRDYDTTDGISSDVFRLRIEIAQPCDTTFILIYRKTVKK